MIITDITPFDNKRSRIYIDGEFAFILYKGEIRDFSLKTGEEISSPVFDEITKVLIPKRAKLRAMNLLKSRDYTEYKLREKLKEGQYSEEVIDEAVEYLKSYKYLDDERYADDYIRYHLKDKSKARLRQDLMQKGISGDIIDKVLLSAYEDEKDDPELLLCAKLLKKKHYDPENMTYEEKQKVMAFLYRKGFSGDVIHRAMSLDTELL